MTTTGQLSADSACNRTVETADSDLHLGDLPRYLRLFFNDAVQKSIAHLAQDALVVQGLDMLAPEELVHEEYTGQRSQEHRCGRFHVKVFTQFAELFANPQEFSKKKPALHDERAVKER